MKKGSLAAAIALAAVASAPFAFAQTKPKPGDKTAPKPATTATPASTPAPPPTTAPASTAASADAAAGATGDKTEGTVTNKGTALDPGEGAPEEGSSTDVTEAPGKRYYFIGLRYRGNLVPRFMLNMFVDEGKSVYTNTIGVELDMRKDDFSLIPAISYAEYGTGDILFKEKNKPSNIIGNYSVVNSGLKALYFTADLLWSAKLGKNVDFEYGAGFGLGIIFGDLITNWVHPDPNGVVAADDGRRFAYCQTAGEGSGCSAAEHQNSSVNKVGGYTEPSWVNGGSKPNVFPWIALPQLGFRFKFIKQLESRFGLGFSLTGFWFGLSGDYGLEQPEKGKSIAASQGGPSLRFH